MRIGTRDVSTGSTGKSFVLEGFALVSLGRIFLRVAGISWDKRCTNGDRLEAGALSPKMEMLRCKE